MRNNNASGHMRPAFNAVLKGGSLLGDITSRLSPGNIVHIPTAEGLLEQLRKWTQSLLPNIVQFSPETRNDASLDITDRQLLVDNMLVSCVYYFAVIPITRSFLIAYLVSRLRG